MADSVVKTVEQQAEDPWYSPSNLAKDAAIAGSGIAAEHGIVKALPYIKTIAPLMGAAAAFVAPAAAVGYSAATHDNTPMTREEGAKRFLAEQIGLAIDSNGDFIDKRYGNVLTPEEILTHILSKYSSDTTTRDIAGIMHQPDGRGRANALEQYVALKGKSNPILDQRAISTTDPIISNTPNIVKTSQPAVSSKNIKPSDESIKDFRARFKNKLANLSDLKE